MIRAAAILIVAWASIAVRADEPSTAFIFPAGGQRGTTVAVRVGGHFLHGTANFEMLGQGIAAKPTVSELATIWFEGPMLHPPESSRKEDYARDHAGEMTLAADAPLGLRPWRVWTSQGVSEHRHFVVGDLPEIIEQEIDGAAIPVHVQLPLTINGRIFPREDIDCWTFEAAAGQEITCEIVAQRIGSPLAARLEIYDSAGQRVALGVDDPEPRVRFRAPAAGKYEARIFDAGYDGLQNAVYRLTMTAGAYVDRVFPLGVRRGGEAALQLAGQHVPAEYKAAIPADAPAMFTLPLPVGATRGLPIQLETGDAPELLEVPGSEPRANAANAGTPAVLNGRIEQPGDVDEWWIEGKKGASYDFDLRAARLGSRLDSVLVVLDATGKELARNDDQAGGQSDSRLTVQAPADGPLVVRVSDRFARRGGNEFAYRLHVSEAVTQPDFQLHVVEETVTVFRNPPAADPNAPQRTPRPQPRRLKPNTVRVDVTRLGNFQEEIELVVEPLPPGVKVDGTKIGKGQPNTTLRFIAEHPAKIGISRLQIRGKAKIGEQEVVRTAGYPALGPGSPVDDVLLAVGLDAPFTLHGEYASGFAAVGSVYQKPFVIERNGYVGPLTVRLADRQMRHLQGLSGPTITIPPETNSFVYPVTLPTWMSLGRTSRAVVMATGEVVDHDGSKHTVSFFNDTQNFQIVCILKAAEITIATDCDVVHVSPNGTAEIGIELARSKSLQGSDARIELATAAHIKGITAEPLVIPAGQTTGRLKLNFAAEAGPLNMPLVLRASSGAGRTLHFAETSVQMLPVAGK